MSEPTKRFSPPRIVYNTWHERIDAIMEPDANGDYVRYEDFTLATQQKEAAEARAREAEREKTCLEEIARCESKYAIGLTAELGALRKDAAVVAALREPSVAVVREANKQLPGLAPSFIALIITAALDAALAVRP